MSDWKTKLIWAYRMATSPYRQLAWYGRVRRQEVPVMVLYYHRVSDEDPSPWTMSCDAFRRQIDWLEENFDLVDLQECQRRISSGSNARPTVSITFDDGYAENCEYALPMLIERRIPVTYFVTTYHTVEQAPFEHDLQRGDTWSPNSIASLVALDASGVEIGAHTRTHADLGGIRDSRVLVDEVIAAGVELESLVGRPIRYFAFPFGQPNHLNVEAAAMLREAGYLGVCSAYGGWNEIGSDPFHLQRIHGDPNLERMKNWLTGDPRLLRVPRFELSSGECDPVLVASTIRSAMSRNGKPPRPMPVPDVAGNPSSDASLNTLPSSSSTSS